MILPNKFLEEKDSLLYVGALLLDKLDVNSFSFLFKN